MIGNKRNFSLSIWDHEDNFLCNLKSANVDFNGQSFNENFVENINGEKSLTFSIPMYIFDIDSKEEDKENTEKSYFKQNEIWKYIYNEQKIRYIEYNSETNEVERQEEFLLKSYTESRNGEEKIAECTCESLAVYELGKIGWNINFDLDYVTSYESLSTNPEIDNLLTIDYWMKKIFYKETNLGRVSNTTECTYLLQGLQLRDDEGWPINKDYISDTTGKYIYERIPEPVCTSTQAELEDSKFYNPSGWTWEVEAKDPRDPSQYITTSTLYEEPVIDRYLRVTPEQYKAFSYQNHYSTSTEDDKKELLPYPIQEEDYGELVYVTNVKKRLFSVERSNVYSIIQTLCETFEVFAYFQYHYDSEGSIDGRKIIFKTEAINEDIQFDFSYGKNLISCQRSTNSDELVTKLIVPDTESNIIDGNILSIKEATANPTAEGYIYNFQYYLDSGMLTSGEDDIYSDEFEINVHNGRIKNYNTRITNLQKYLVPLYARQDNLNSELSTQRAARTALMDNIQSIQDKIDNIPPNQQIINSWSQYTTDISHVGETKTITLTTYADDPDCYYLDFGREDIVYEGIEDIVVCTINKEKELVTGTTTSVSTFIPRCFNGVWTPGSGVKYDDDTTNSFVLLNRFNTATSTAIDIPVKTTIRGKEVGFIKGIIMKIPPIVKGEDQQVQTFIRVRYQRAPLIWYYILIKDYWEQIIETEAKIATLENQLLEINNRIIVNELSLNNLLSEKNKEILQFEKKYKAYIREGYWEASDYQGQIAPKSYDTDNKEVFNGLITVSTALNELNLNESLSTYSYYFDLGERDNIEIDSISMITHVPETKLSHSTNPIPRYRGNDFELYLSRIGEKLHTIVGIAPSLINNYEIIGYSTEYYKCDISFFDKTINSITTEEREWWKINSVRPPIIEERYIYLTDDNIITDSIKIDGIKENTTTTISLSTYDDFTYTFDYAGYDRYGERVDLNEQQSYSTNISYDYITKIVLKDTDKVSSLDHFIVHYNEETTLQYLYQDAVLTSKKYAVPQVTYDIGVLDISSLQGYKNYKPKIGQKVPIYDPEMGFNGFEGIITSISRVLEKPQDTNITIATYSTRFEDVFKKLTSTMSEIRYNSSALYNAADAFTETGALKPNVFQKSLADNSYEIALGTDNDVTIDKQAGITLIDKANNNAVKFIGRGVFLTEDYNEKDESKSKWVTGITGEGINANALVTGNIDTKNINIWNATEGQVRFRWNEEGLIAYGAKGDTGGSTTTSASTVQDFIDYNKFVKFNYDGLDFQDNTDNISRSAVRLGWGGLDIQAQGGALNLTGDKGIIVKDSTTTRLQLGRLEGNKIYGLRINNRSGNPSFQSDSKGDLWLAEHINIGGGFDTENGEPIEPTGGIYGMDTTSNIKEQMGPKRDNSGGPEWDSDPLRFWAGPRTTTEFATDEPDLWISQSTKINQAGNNAPALARFRVSNEGRIVASGIDVGGWIGSGNFLRSKGYQAILRSEGYTNEIPVLAIGTNTNSVTTGTEVGKNYNFRVFQDGSIKIGNEDFTATSTGSVTIKNGDITIKQGGIYLGPIGNNEYNFSADSNGIVKARAIDIISGTTAGFKVLGNEIYITSGTNTTKISSSTKSGAHAIEIGSVSNPQFYVTNAGYMRAADGEIAGWKIETDKLSKTVTGGYVALNAPSNATSTSVLIQAGTSNSSANTKFKVTADGTVTATNANITGTINANTGKIGDFSINSSGQLYTNNKSAADTGTGVLLSKDIIALGTNFKVTNSGVITAKSGTIGGWNIESDKLYIGSGSSFVGMRSASGDSTKVFFAGATDKVGSSAKFSVQANGKVTIDSNNTTATANKILSIKKSGTEVFYINDLGKIYVANDADIKGKITATSGTIGSFNIGTYLTTNSKGSYNDGKAGIFIGSTGIGLGANFYVTSAGAITAKSGTIAGFSFDTDEIYSGAVNDYKIDIRKPSTSTGYVFVAGTGSDWGGSNEFTVQADGTLKATKATITGKITANSGQIGNWNIATDTNKNLYSGSGANYIGLYPKTDSTSTSPVIFIGNSSKTTSNDTNTKFKVSSDGSVFFHGGIYGWSTQKGGFRPGKSAGTINLRTDTGNPISVEINQGLIIDINE